MTPDIWLTSVSHFYALAEEGTTIFAGAACGDVDNFGNAQGVLEIFEEPHVIGLRGVFTQRLAADPTSFHELEVSISKPVHFPPENAVVSITDTVTHVSIETPEAYGGFTRSIPPSINASFNLNHYVAGEGDTYGSVWMFADPSRILISSAAAAVLGYLDPETKTQRLGNTLVK